VDTGAEIGPEAVETKPLGVARGLSWAVGGYLVAFMLSIVTATIYLAAAGLETLEDLSISATALLQLPLWVGLAGAPLLASRRSGTGSLTRDFGLKVERRDIGLGLGIGLLTQVVLVPLLYLLLLPLIGDRDVSEEARELADRAEGIGGAVLLVLIVVILAPVVEELFYRGLLLRGLERPFARRYGAHWGRRLALGCSAIVFGVSHYQLIQLPALVMFGFVVGWLALRHERLGPSIFAHVAFNGVTVAALLADVI